MQGKNNRGTHVVDIFPNDFAMVRPVGPLVTEQNDEWAITRRYLTLETIESMCDEQNIDIGKLATL